MDTPNDTTEVSDEVAAARAAKMAEMQARPGAAPLEDRVQTDYFGEGEVHTVYLPDGVSWMQHKELNEGARRKYLSKVNREVAVNRQTQDLRIKMAAGEERAELFRVAIVGWNLVRNGQPVPFNRAELDKVLEQFPPHVLDVVEADIRKHNKWLSGEVTLEDLRKEREHLDELIAEKEQEEAGNDVSSS